MRPEDIFPPDETGNLDESIRIDREVEDEDRLDLLRDYHITKESKDFLTDFFLRTLGRTEQKRRGWNHWLYGYYGSGKSHLLAVLGNLVDSAWIQDVGQDEVWRALTHGNGTQEVEELRDLWEETLTSYHLKPLFVNLLKHQGREDKGFNDILLGESHVEEGLSRRLDVAYFERWYQQKGRWETRHEDARRILNDESINDLPDEPWKTVQKYRVYSDIVRPALFEEITGTPDGLDDLQPSYLNPSEVVSELETWRTRLEDEADKSVKLVLLLDEISLFIGTDSDRLTELQLVAERIDDTGQGDILSVVTAQEWIEHVQPEYAGKRPDFSILKGRFPHRYQLPSRHVGEIVENRLLAKPDDLRQRLEEEILQGTTIRPDDTFIYSNVQQNTEPQLDDLDPDRFLDYYPLLPFHPPLFMEILSNLRDNDVDRAKSIFSGTARAVLALVDALLANWRDERTTTELVNLVDFYDIIRPELLEIIPQKVEAIDEIEADVERGTLEPIDADVAKAVLLLQYATDLIPVDHHENIAVSIMRDLEGPTRIAMSNQVDDALERLDKYLGPELEFRDAEQREIYADSQAYEERSDWDELFEPIGDTLWEDIVQQLDLPEKLPYGEDGDTYPVTYGFEIDGRPIYDTFGADEGLHIPIIVEGVLPAATDSSNTQDKLLWKAKQEGRSPVRDALRRWASLANAMAERPPQETVQKDLEQRRNEAAKLVADLLSNGSFQVRDQTTQNRNAALKQVLQRRYPSHFHPLMLDIEERHLRELTALEPGDERPEWAVTLEVPTEDPATHEGDIQTRVRLLIGQSINQSEQNQLSVPRLLSLLGEEESFYTDVQKALVAILWGLCRKGDFLPVDQQGEPVQADDLLDPDQWSEIQIRIAELQDQFREAVEEIPGIEPQHSNDEALVQLQEFLQRTMQELHSLEDDIEVTQDVLLSDPVINLLNALSSALNAKQTGTQSRLDELGAADTDWETLVDGVLESREWINNVRERWTRRRNYLLHLDALVALPVEEVEWVEGHSQELLDSLQDELGAATDVEWWSSPEWQEFVTAISSRDEAVEALSDAWNEYREEEGREELAEQIEAHKWTVQPLELPPSKVHKAFQNQLLYPLRMFQKAFEEQTRLASRLINDPSDTAYQELLWLLDNLTDVPERHDDVPSVESARDLLERLNSIVGDRSFDDINGIGLVPDDAEGLRSNLKELDDPDERTIQDVEGEVVIE